MTEDVQAGEPGAVATRSGDDASDAPPEPVYKPGDFRLNLEARLGASAEPHADLDNPAIRKLTWEHVVPDRPESADAAAATHVPLPPPRRVVPPKPPKPLQPPAATAPHADETEFAVDAVEEDVVDGTVVEEVVADADAVVADVVVEPEPARREEINRLASIPDLVEDDSPIELRITPSGPVVAHPHSVYMPVLAETLYVPPPTRPVATPTATMFVADTTAHRTSRRKPKRSLLRTFTTAIILLGLLAGGAFAAKQYLLQQPKWSAEMQPLADAVAAARGLEFKTPVDVTTVPVAEYAKRLAASAHPTQPDRAPVLRALGLLQGDLDLEAIGSAATSDEPAFYDPDTKTIVVAGDLPTYVHLYRFALHRALTVALLDQQYDWSTRAASAPVSGALALRAAIDADALTVAESFAATDAPDQLATEVAAFAQAHALASAPSPYLAAIAGRAGVAMRPVVAALASQPSALADLEQTTPVDDSRFDAARTAPATTTAVTGTQGITFWYYVLASRIDDAQAWSAATRWASDSLATSTGAANQCVDAKIAASNPDGAAVLLAAFNAWAAAAPPESTTTVVPIDGDQVAIRACDPGVAVTAALVAKVPVAFGGAPAERALVAAAISAASGSQVDGACLVQAVRTTGFTLTMPADDAPVVGMGWQPPYVTANLGLALPCITPAG